DQEHGGDEGVDLVGLLAPGVERVERLLVVVEAATGREEHQCTGGGRPAGPADGGALDHGQSVSPNVAGAIESAGAPVPLSSAAGGGWCSSCGAGPAIAPPMPTASTATPKAMAAATSAVRLIWGCELRITAPMKITAASAVPTIIAPKPAVARKIREMQSST